MNIVTSTRGNFIDGLLAALATSGFNVVIWEPRVKPLLDMMYELKPSIIFHTNGELGPAMDLAKEKYKTNWYNLNERPLVGKTDLVKYLGARPQDKYRCDIGLFNYYLESSDLSNWSNFKVRIWGNKPMETPFYVGELKSEDRKHAVASSTHWICYTQEEIQNARLCRTNPIWFNALGVPTRNLTKEVLDYAQKIAIEQTYFHTAAEILNSYNMENKCLETLSTLLEQHQLKM